MRRFQRVRIPRNVHPLVVKLFEEMNHQQIGMLDMSERTGIGQSTMKHWRTMCSPSLANLEACYNVLGYELALKPNHKKFDGDPHHEAAVTPEIGEPHGRGRLKSNNF